MTWNDLINLLQEIPESRREETAAFMLREDGSVEEIDCKEEIELDEFHAIACNMGNDKTTYVLST